MGLQDSNIPPTSPPPPLPPLLIILNHFDRWIIEVGI